MGKIILNNTKIIIITPSQCSGKQWGRSIYYSFKFQLCYKFCLRCWKIVIVKHPKMATEEVYIFLGKL